MLTILSKAIGMGGRSIILVEGGAAVSKKQGKRLQKILRGKRTDQKEVFHCLKDLNMRTTLLPVLRSALISLLFGTTR